MTNPLCDYSLQVPYNCLKVSKLESESAVKMTAWGDIKPGDLVTTSKSQKLCTFAAYITTGWLCVIYITEIIYFPLIYAMMPVHLSFCPSICDGSALAHYS